MYPTANVTKNSYTAKYLGLFNNLFLALSMYSYKKSVMNPFFR